MRPKRRTEQGETPPDIPTTAPPGSEEKIRIPMPPPADRKRRSLSEADRRLAVLLARGLRTEQAAREVGCSASTAYRRLRRTDFRLLLEQLRNDEG